MHDKQLESDPMAKSDCLGPDVERALEWISVRSAAVVVAEREKATRAIEALAKELTDSSEAQRWLDTADADVY